jgi:hypothetical protein
MNLRVGHRPARQVRVVLCEMFRISAETLIENMGCALA